MQLKLKNNQFPLIYPETIYVILCIYPCNDKLFFLWDRGFNTNDKYSIVITDISLKYTGHLLHLPWKKVST